MNNLQDQESDIRVGDTFCSYILKRQDVQASLPVLSIIYMGSIAALYENDDVKVSKLSYLAISLGSFISFDLTGSNFKNAIF